MAGLLYVVATPIGNLKDITLRAAEVLREVDFVVAEDRQKALKLLSHLDIRKPIITINSYNEERRASAIVGRLGSGKKAALITAAGTPCISDPGDMVVREACEAGIGVLAVPGPSAALAALSVSGLSPARFLFYGFLPQKKGKKRKTLRELLSGLFPVVLLRIAPKDRGNPRRRQGRGAGEESRRLQGADQAARGNYEGPRRGGAGRGDGGRNEGGIYDYRRGEREAGSLLTLQFPQAEEIHLIAHRPRRLRLERRNL